MDLWQDVRLGLARDLSPAERRVVREIESEARAIERAELATALAGVLLYGRT